MSYSISTYFHLTMMCIFLPLVTSSESGRHYVQINASLHLDVLGIFGYDVSLLDCGFLCDSLKAGRPPCNGYTWDENRTCELFTGQIMEAYDSGRMIWKYDPDGSVVDGKSSTAFSFFVSTFEANYYDARDYCVSQGAALIHLDSTSDLHVIDQYQFQVPADELWVGANDLKQEGEFVCEKHGLPLDRSIWRFWSGEPNDEFAIENCVIVSVYDLGLNDVDCDRMYYFICEYY